MLNTCHTLQKRLETENKKKALKIHPIYIIDADHDYILDEIMCRYQINFFRYIDIKNESNDNNEKP